MQLLFNFTVARICYKIQKLSLGNVVNVIWVSNVTATDTLSLKIANVYGWLLRHILIIIINNFYVSWHLRGIIRYCSWFFLCFLGETWKPTVWRGYYEGCADRAQWESFSCRMRRGKKAPRGKTWRSRGKETGQRKSIVRLLIEKWGRFMGYRQTVLLPYSTSSISL